MGRFHLQDWACIETMNQSAAVRCPHFSVFARYRHPEGWTPNKRFMRSAGVLPAVFGVPPKTSPRMARHCLVRFQRANPVGGTPTGATGTVALPAASHGRSSDSRFSEV